MGIEPCCKGFSESLKICCCDVGKNRITTTVFLSTTSLLDCAPPLWNQPVRAKFTGIKLCLSISSSGPQPFNLTCPVQPPGSAHFPVLAALISFNQLCAPHVRTHFKTQLPLSLLQKPVLLHKPSYLQAVCFFSFSFLPLTLFLCLMLKDSSCLSVLLFYHHLRLPQKSPHFKYLIIHLLAVCLFPSFSSSVSPDLVSSFCFLVWFWFLAIQFKFHRLLSWRSTTSMPKSWRYGQVARPSFQQYNLLFFDTQASSMANGLLKNLADQMFVGNALLALCTGLGSLFTCLGRAGFMEHDSKLNWSLLHVNCEQLNEFVWQCSDLIIGFLFCFAHWLYFSFYEISPEHLLFHPFSDWMNLILQPSPK
ncbi:hypothetical protein VP01_1795g1 [Puccinia sorghi]|uniref:Uncharacterized protein n=1 Tax=Puccinia sorghi TaxID=27349 RepID=A0A0L6VED3_9BASI|nr:hypothetical protein VP01_1795g1 [Puccinia sorghi]